MRLGRYGACLLSSTALMVLLMGSVPQCMAQTNMWQYVGKNGSRLVLPFHLERTNASDHVGWIRKVNTGQVLYSVIWSELAQPNTITPEEIMQSLFRDRKSMLEAASASTIDEEEIGPTGGRLQVAWCDGEHCFMQRIVLRFRWNRGVMVVLTARLENLDDILNEWSVIEEGLRWQA